MIEHSSELKNWSVETCLAGRQAPNKPYSSRSYASVSLSQRESIRVNMLSLRFVSIKRE